ncbi:hypothetical protein DDE18_04085 [Nocardioides gansuensis]|uniref:CarD-like/TRCF RNAP-interacting domain-containing protein n=1 Tax=Nocardioides gansuensis TaxID=2138300 RepID=A0A2T8FGQ3_9ACTN|nr:CarD family transcriptional regulator [Nocardioides gansuensis]PVG84892.1 hypothetical protein DDE18_04085 [Nocardioides gansuensis]
MTTYSAPRPRHLASSPFKAPPEQVVEQYKVGDLVSHDAHGVGRVVGMEAAAVTVDFGSRTVRVVSPYTKLELL